MKRPALAFLGLWLSLSSAEAVVQSQLMANADLLVGPNTYAVVINNTWTVGHTITLPPASATAIGQSGASSYYQNGLVIYDAAQTLSGSHVLTITPASGDTINGASSLTTSIAGAVVTLSPTSGYGWTATIHGPGTFPSTTCTNQFVRSIATTGIGTCASVALATDVSGILGQSHGGAGSITGALKGDGSGNVSQAACADLSDSHTGCTTTVTAYASAAIGQLPGTTTNDNASAGNIGEFVSATVATGSAVSLTTVTAANLTSISLTAGDWDVWCAGHFNMASTTTVTLLEMSISTTSATRNTTAGEFFQQGYPNGTVIGNNAAVTAFTQKRLSLSTTTTVYAVAFSSFGTSTNVVWGGIFARRVR